MNKKTRVPESTAYRLDHKTMGKWFGGRIFDKASDAQKWIDNRTPKQREKYQKTLTIVKITIPAHDSYDLGTIKL